jgi:hypothetical protein
MFRREFHDDLHLGVIERRRGDQEPVGPRSNSRGERNWHLLWRASSGIDDGEPSGGAAA